MAQRPLSPKRESNVYYYSWLLKERIVKMTEYELVSISAEMAQIYQGINETALAILTGYLLIAHYIGKNLSLGQVSFVNILFVLNQFALFFTGQEKAEVAAYFEAEASKLNPEIPFREVVQGESALPVAELTYILVTVAALAFMWRVRHPKSV